MTKDKKLKILFVASEAAPYSKVGGLGEVLRALPKELRELGHDARVMTPKYASMDVNKFSLKMEMKDLKPILSENDPNGLFVSNVLRHENEKGETLAYFLENMEYYEKRANPYGYNDDHVRWALLAKGTLEFLKQSSWQPDVIVAADWHTGLIPNYLHTDYKNDSILSKIAVVFSIHNLVYQGMFDPHFVSDMDYDSGQEEISAFNNPRLAKLNFMRRGIMYADVINTVSPTYANEITTPEFGELLDELLKERRSRLFGILNGTDYEVYSPETNPALVQNYNSRSLEKRLKNKAALQKEFNLPLRPETPLFSIVSRLTDQKGFSLLLETAEPLFRNFNIQLIVAGTGEANFMSFFQNLTEKYPRNMAGHFTFDDVLAHRIFSGADAVLIPSKFEPSGLTQMEAMRYGTVPLVRKTGGLADSVTDYDPKTKRGTGFVFESFDQYSFFGAVVRAIETYRYSKVWQEIQRQGMKSDFSWASSAKEYGQLFEKAIALHVQQTAE